MKPVFELARREKRKVIYAEGEDERVLRAVQIVVDEGIIDPILIGRPEVIVRGIERLGLRLKEGRDFSLTDPESDPRYEEYWKAYHQITQRHGVSPDLARPIIRSNTPAIAAMRLLRGEVDARLCGTSGP